MIKALIFDMDGLLADTEPLWQEAEIMVFNKVGIPLNHDLCRQVMGQRLDEVVKHWLNKYQKKHLNPKELENAVIIELLKLIDQKAELLPGVNQVLDFADAENLPKALASSSSMQIIEHLLSKLNIRKRFNILCSAENEIYGKPHPSIFLTALQKLGVEPWECLVFEDSINGVIAAKAARMPVVAIPESARLYDPRFSIANKVINSLNDLTFPISDCLNDNYSTTGVPNLKP